MGLLRNEEKGVIEEEGWEMEGEGKGGCTVCYLHQLAAWQLNLLFTYIVPLSYGCFRFESQTCAIIASVTF